MKSIESSPGTTFPELADTADPGRPPWTDRCGGDGLAPYIPQTLATARGRCAGSLAVQVGGGDVGLGRDDQLPLDRALGGRMAVVVPVGQDGIGFLRHLVAAAGAPVDAGAGDVQAGMEDLVERGVLVHPQIVGIFEQGQEKLLGGRQAEGLALRRLQDGAEPAAPSRLPRCLGPRRSPPG